MKTTILPAVLITNPFSEHFRELGLLLSSPSEKSFYYEVSFFNSRSVFLPGEFLMMPRQFQLPKSGEKLVTVCAWCPDRNPDTEKKLTLAGYNLSHGICQHCRTRELEKHQQQLTKETVCTM